MLKKIQKLHHCPFCEYSWKGRKATPKRCPCCMRWLWKRNESGMYVPDVEEKEKEIVRATVSKPNPDKTSSHNSCEVKGQ
jgi:hypothetical protein